MSASATEIAEFIQQYVKQQQCHHGARVMGLTGEQGYHSVDSGARYHFIIGLAIDLHDKTVQMNITKGHYYQALTPLHQYVLDQSQCLMQWAFNKARVMSSAMRTRRWSPFTHS